MLGSDEVAAASDLLVQHWREGRSLAQLPPELRPASRAEGYAIQARLEGLSRASLFGWKIAATSRAGQQHINVDGPLAGRLLSDRAFESGCRMELGANRMRVAEPEFAFRMAATLSPRDVPYDMEEVLDAVDSLYPAIEIPDSRYEDYTTVGAPQLIADNACAHYFVLGPEAPASWRSTDLSRHRVAGSVAGKLERDGSGANVLGDPRIALTWLVNELSGLGISLKANEVVTTGTCLVPLAIAAGDRVTADFGHLGKVAADFVA
ncbi:MAG: hydratase [Pseudomonadota bacterium]|nr:hydratase [Pseudomonadota bacterium]